MEARRLAALLSHLSPSSHPHRPKKPENRHGHGAVLATSDRHENWRVYIENDSEDVRSLKLQDASSNECRVEEIEEASQTSTCIQKRTTNDTTTSGSEIGFATTMEDKQEIESESTQTGSKDLRRIDITARNNAIVSRNNAMTGEKIGFVEDCIFCLIVQGRSPAFKLYEDEMCICILDVHPLTDGHSLIIPKAHFHSLEFTPPEVAAAMCATVPFISMAIMEATSSDSFNLIVNSGKAAGQVVFHTHFHIIPRKSGDNLWRSESVCRPMLCVGHETSQLVRQIRHNLSGKCS